MRVIGKILLALLIFALLYGVFLYVEGLTRQELMSAAEPSTQEAACLMWQPRFFRSEGVCELELRNAEGKIVDIVRLGTLGSGLDALQQFGLLAFQGQDLIISSRLTGEPVRRFKVHEGRLRPPE